MITSGAESSGVTLFGFGGVGFLYGIFISGRLMISGVSLKAAG